MEFLKLYFPKEVKTKQLEIEKAAGMEQLQLLGLGLWDNGRCMVS